MAQQKVSFKKWWKNITGTKTAKGKKKKLKTGQDDNTPNFGDMDATHTLTVRPSATNYPPLALGWTPQADVHHLSVSWTTPNRPRRPPTDLFHPWE